MKQFLLIAILILYSKAFSQSVEKSIIVKDIDTDLPIEDATVSILASKQNFMSNTEGKVNFVIKKASSILVSHSSYLSITLRSISLKDEETIVYLKSNVNSLTDIIVTRKHPQKILKSLVENSIKSLTVPARLKVYAREFFKLNGDYTYYNDGLLNFQLTGTSINLENKILVEQNRSYGLIDSQNDAEFLGYNLNNIMDNYYNFKYLAPLLEPKAKKEYDYILQTYSANNDYFMIVATPKDNVDGLKDDFVIIYDTQKKIIIEVSSDISPLRISKNIENTAVGSKNIYKSSFKTIYRCENLNYYLVSSREEIGYERVDKNKTTDVDIKNCLVTTNFSTKNYTYKNCDVYKDKTLFCKKNKILTDYWNESGLTATDEELQIIERIEFEK
ncbi:MAG: hypothetical protein V4548_07855 [Bacteroidota bacterium]